MKLTVRELVTFSLLGTILFCSKILTSALPNIHFLAMLIIAYTVVFRAKALYAVGVFILLTAVFSAGLWWIPYVYLWPLLWGVTMLLPKRMPPKVAVPVYMAVACLHGLLYGTLYAPFQALLYGLSRKGMIAWILAGLPWDLTHGIGNLCAAALTLPVIRILQRVTGVSDTSRA